MTITFNTNVPSLSAQRYLDVSSERSAASLTKLSSGLRIPSAKYGAADLAIGSRLGSEVASLRQAATNTGQGTSLLQIAEGAMGQISDILTRMSSLAVQSNSGQLSDQERALLNSEFTELQSEVDRIANDTDFNGTKLINGGDVVASFQEGEDGGLDAEGIGISFDTNTTNDGDVFRVDYNYTDAATDTGSLTVTNLTSGEQQTIDIASTIQGQTGETSTDLTTDLSPGQSVDINFSAVGVTLTLDDRFDVNTDFNQSVTANTTSSTTQTTLENNATITFLDGGDVTGAQFDAITGLDTNTGILSLDVNDDADDVLDINANAGLEFSTDGTTYTATITGATADGSTASSVFVRATGSDQPFLEIDLQNVDITGANGGTNNTFAIDLGRGLARLTETAGTSTSFSFQVGTGVTASEDSLSVTINSVTTSALGVGSDTIDTTANAATAITNLDSAIDTLNSARASVGAAQSRLEFANANLSTSIENSEAAKSALLDVDVSKEITEFTAQQVLIEAGVSMLAQANQQPGQLLRLLES